MTRADSRRRRCGVSAPSVSPDELTEWRPPVYEKSDGERNLLIERLRALPLLFGHLSFEAEKQVADAMRKKSVAKGTNLIIEGAQGDYYYTVDQGRFHFIVERERGGKKVAEVVGEAGPGASFGELALLHNAPRAATVRAITDATVYALDVETFRMMLTTAENTKKRKHEDFLDSVPIFKDLNRFEKCQLSDMLVTETYNPGWAIIRQGEVGDRFFLLESGAASCWVDPRLTSALLPSTLDDLDIRNETDNGVGAESKRKCIGEEEAGEGEIEVELPSVPILVKVYEPGDSFGELALLNATSVRQASIFAITRCTLLTIDKATFDRVLGPLRSIFEKRKDVYKKVTKERLLSHRTPRGVTPRGVTARAPTPREASLRKKTREVTESQREG